MFTDLHCHILPNLDDGAADLATSLAMARAATADGIDRIACTPHIYPGLYPNDAAGISRAKERLAAKFREEGIDLELAVGADIHMVPELVTGLQSGRLPTINASRYLLLEPSHHIAPPRLEETIFELIAHGYVPLITHPERLAWIEDHYQRMVELGRQGAWLQVTAASLMGDFGRRARYWAERMISEGVVHVLATDAHGAELRPPLMSDGMVLAQRFVGAEEAEALTTVRTSAAWEDRPPEQVTRPPGYERPRRGRRAGWMKRFARCLGR